MVISAIKILRWDNRVESDNLYGQSALAKTVCAKKITSELRSKLREQSPHIHRQEFVGEYKGQKEGIFDGR